MKIGEVRDLGLGVTIEKIPSKQLGDDRRWAFGPTHPGYFPECYVVDVQPFEGIRLYELRHSFYSHQAAFYLARKLVKARAEDLLEFEKAEAHRT